MVPRRARVPLHGVHGGRRERRRADLHDAHDEREVARPRPRDRRDMDHRDGLFKPWLSSGAETGLPGKRLHGRLCAEDLILVEQRREMGDQIRVVHKLGYKLLERD